MLSINGLNFLTHINTPKKYNQTLSGGSIVNFQAGSDFDKEQVEIPDLVLNDNEQEDDVAMWDLVFKDGKRVLEKRINPDYTKSPYLKNLTQYYLRLQSTPEQKRGLQKMRQNKQERDQILDDARGQQRKTRDDKDNNFWSGLKNGFTSTIGTAVDVLTGSSRPRKNKNKFK